jgi:Leucine-rich repeat (LRR) protein
MQEAVQRQIRGLPKNEVDELTLEGLHCTELSPSDRALLESFPNLQFLSMNNCGLRSLNNFPHLPKLIKLELNDNALTGGLDKLLVLRDLMQVSLMGNQFNTIQDISPLLQLSDLVVVDLLRCPVALLTRYRETLFARLPRLEILDGTNQNGEAASLSENEEDDEVDCESGAEELDDGEISEIDVSEGDNSAQEDEEEHSHKQPKY